MNLTLIFSRSGLVRRLLLFVGGLRGLAPGKRSLVLGLGFLERRLISCLLCLDRRNLVPLLGCGQERFSIGGLQRLSLRRLGQRPQFSRDRVGAGVLVRIDGYRGEPFRGLPSVGNLVYGKG